MNNFFNLTVERIDYIYCHFKNTAPVPENIKEKIIKHNISLCTLQDSNDFNIKCLTGENLCLKGAGKESSNFSHFYASLSEFWTHIYSVHKIDHAKPHQILKIVKNLNIGYSNMHGDIRNYLLLVCPRCVHANFKYFKHKSFQLERYQKICECIGEIPNDPQNFLKSNKKPPENYRGHETAMPLSFIIGANPSLYIGEPLYTKNIPFSYHCNYRIINRDETSEMRRPLIFSPYISQLNTLPLDLNDIPMSVTVPELFQEPYLHSFKSLPLYKTNSFVFSIGYFRNIENENMPFYLIIAIDINDINNNHYLLNSRPLLQGVLKETFLFPESKLREYTKKKLIDIIPFTDINL
ncbi:hypothetical protein RB653_000506 [Dictyostelium firmibasis]|uniref:Uncharacterized protein n=1 Tax=Dictyostelium firmibasis TaxID=79012 RepID=A0AAN7TWS1_9MYCE